MCYVMEKNLLKIFKLADLLNEKQDKVYAEIYYSADSRKKLEIAIRSKKDFSFLEKCELSLADNPLLKWNNTIALFESYVNGGYIK